MKYLIVWSMLATLNGHPIAAGDVTDKTEIDTRAACEQAIEARKDHMPDYIRGMLRFSFDVEVAVKGDCRPAGQPT